MSPNDPQFLGVQDIVIYKLGRIESMLQEIKDNQEAHAAADAIFHTDAKKRIESLEKTRNYGLGIATSIGFFLSLALNAFFKWGHL